jgi:hypothetical protein
MCDLPDMPVARVVCKEPTPTKDRPIKDVAFSFRGRYATITAGGRLPLCSEKEKR